MLAGYVAGGIDPEAKEHVGALTARAREILTLLGGGLSNSDIGARLYLSIGAGRPYVRALSVAGGKLTIALHPATANAE